MSRGDWGIGIAALVLSLGYPVDQACSAQPRTKQGHSQPEESAEPASYDAIQNQLDRIASAMERASNEQNAAQEEDRAERDLAAQEGMEKWAFWMFLAAAVSTILSVVGIFLIWRTLVHTRRAADAAWDAVEDTSNATKAMVAQNELTREAQRPWIKITLTIDQVTFQDNGVVAFPITMTLANVGQTAAQSVHCEVRAFLYSDPEPWDCAPSKRLLDVTILPGEKESVLRGLGIPFERLSTCADYANKGVFMPTVIARATYEVDGSGKLGTTEFIGQICVINPADKTALVIKRPEAGVGKINNIGVTRVSSKAT